jgi:aspartate/methionine/tyrosine aminotransferase
MRASVAVLTRADLNRDLLRAEYAVRGAITLRAQELEAQGRRIIYCNIGNPQAFVQKPLTYLRQILALVEYPALLDDPVLAGRFPADVVKKARHILATHPHGTGAYTQSSGIPFIRQAVAEFITRRDGIPADQEHILLTDGASKGVEAAIVALLRDRNDGIMIPIPQYPLYSAEIALRGGRAIGYYLDEEHHWQLREEGLTASLSRARAEGTRPVAIAVINPGNPTGAVLTPDEIAIIVRFARANGLAIFADEVYQENVYAGFHRFHSFAKTMHEMKETTVPLFSFHSVSKGFLGECGHRGGYVELRNLPADVMAELVKLQSIALCANVVGQIAVYVMVSPPVPGEESYARFVEERDGILQELKAKAEVLGLGINAIPGMSLEMPQGAMYGFVRFQLPPEPHVDIAAMSPEQRREHEARRDSAYCLSLLEETGICVVPGSGLGQVPGTFHFRTTFLPSKEEIEEVVRKLAEFHKRYAAAPSRASRSPQPA